MEFIKRRCARIPPYQAVEKALMSARSDVPLSGVKAFISCRSRKSSFLSEYRILRFSSALLDGSSRATCQLIEAHFLYQTGGLSHITRAFSMRK